MKLHRDDSVVITAGNYRGQGPAKIISVDVINCTVSVDGIGSAIRHVKRGHPKSPQGGRVALPVSIHVSNVSLHCASCGFGVRAKCELVGNIKRRVCGRCRKSI